MNRIFTRIGEAMAAYLTRPHHMHAPYPSHSAERLLACLQPGDVLLIESNNRIGSIIKYLTQSTWSHAALFVGPHLAEAGTPAGHSFIEADIIDGVRSVGIEEFAHLHTRICRPFGLSEDDCRQVCSFAIQRIGNQYDLRNVLDLARYFLPSLPLRFRRRWLSLGSGDPSRAICSTLIAQAFQSIHYPILPLLDVRSAHRPDCPGCVQETYRIRHHSLFTPRDFDVSPYFRIINPLAADGFDFKTLVWESSHSTTRIEL